MPPAVPTSSAHPERGGQKAYEVVLRHIEQEILDGTLQVGSQLPPERELAASLHVSRSAAREAIRALEAQGVLRSGVGVGPAGGTRVTDQRSRALTRLLRLQVALAQFPFHEVVELRVGLERTAASLAAREATAADLSRIEKVLGAMDAPGITIEVFNELDNEFHVLIAQAGGMDLVSDLCIAVRESVRLPILDGSRRLEDWHSFRGDLSRHHRQIFEALQARDAERAAQLMESHIRVAYSTLLS